MFIWKKWKNHKQRQFNQKYINGLSTGTVYFEFSVYVILINITERINKTRVTQCVCVRDILCGKTLNVTNVSVWKDIVKGDQTCQLFPTCPDCFSHRIL